MRKYELLCWTSIQDTTQYNRQFIVNEVSIDDT